MYLFVSQELVKYSARLGEDTSDLQKALELMLGVPHRANDIKFISSIEGYHGNIHKLGRLLRHVSTFVSNSMKQDLSTETNSCLDSQEIFHPLWNQMVHYHIQNTQPYVSIENQ
jgi:hypothetical protein